MTQPPGGRHRQLGPLQRLLQRAGSVLLVIAALSLGNLVINLTPGTNTRERPFLRSGTTGDLVDARRFEATVLNTRVAAVVKAGGWKHDTQGRWIIVRVRLVAKGEPVLVSYAALHDAQGRSFLASDRLKQPLIDGSRILQPGIGVEGDVVFEVPMDAVRLTARFADDAISQRMDAMTDIALPLPEAVWLAPEPVETEPLEVKP